ncbi:MAG: hypothetical protein QME40_07140 [bacterium]|nr:hypothetical protein [bacterium]
MELPSFTIAEAEPVALFIPKFSKETHIKTISKSECLERILAFNELALEIQGYSRYAAVLNLLWAKEGLLKSRLESLEALLNKVRCYELGIKPGEDLQSVVDKTVYKIIK